MPMGTVQRWRVPLWGQDNLGSSLGEAVHTATERDPEPGPPSAFPGTWKHQVIGEGVHWTPCGASWGLTLYLCLHFSICKMRIVM